MSKFTRINRRVSHMSDVPREVLKSHPLPDLYSPSSADVESRFPQLNIYGKNPTTHPNLNDVTSFKHKGSTNKVMQYSLSKIPQSSGGYFSEPSSSDSSSSSSSWWEDDFEGELTQKVQDMLDEFDAFIFEDVNELRKLSLLVESEGRDWKHRFTSFRVTGKKIPCSAQDTTQCNLIPRNNSLTSLNRSSPIKNREALSKPLTSETFATSESLPNQNDVYEEIIATDATPFPLFGNAKGASHEITAVHIKLLKEMILDNLMEKLWPEVCSALQQYETDDQSYDVPKVESPGGRFHLPPLTLPMRELFTPSSSPVRCNPAQSLWKEPSVKMPPKQELDGILTVSAKVLQCRNISKYCMQVMQPRSSRPQSSSTTSSYRNDTTSEDLSDAETSQQQTIMYPRGKHLPPSFSSATYSPVKVQHWLTESKNSVTFKPSKASHRQQSKLVSPMEGKGSVFNVKFSTSKQICYKEFFLPPIRWQENEREVEKLGIASANLFAQGSLAKDSEALSNRSKKEKVPSHLPLLKTPRRNVETCGKSLIPTRKQAVSMVCKEENDRK